MELLKILFLMLKKIQRQNQSDCFDGYNAIQASRSGTENIVR